VRDVRWLSVAHGAPIAFDEEGGGTGRLNLKGRGTRVVPTEGGALVLWHNPLRTGGHWCSGVIKPGWRRIRKLGVERSSRRKKMVRGCLTALC
jgi:hypothetical protein